MTQNTQHPDGPHMVPMFYNGELVCWQDMSASGRAKAEARLESENGLGTFAEVTQ